MNKSILVASFFKKIQSFGQMKFFNFKMQRLCGVKLHFWFATPTIHLFHSRPPYAFLIFTFHTAMWSKIDTSLPHELTRSYLSTEITHANFLFEGIRVCAHPFIPFVTVMRTFDLPLFFSLHNMRCKCMCHKRTDAAIIKIVENSIRNPSLSLWQKKDWADV